jgi:hypothetical protein
MQGRVSRPLTCSALSFRGRVSELQVAPGSAEDLVTPEAHADAAWPGVRSC